VDELPEAEVRPILELIRGRADAAAPVRVAHERNAERTDPLNGPLRLVETTSCSHEELHPHMNGWSTHGLYRR
jgi:hypothetical protein